MTTVSYVAQPELRVDGTVLNAQIVAVSIEGSLDGLDRAEVELDGWTADGYDWFAGTLDFGKEVSIAVAGSAGPACHERRAKASRTDTQEWRDDGWVECAARSAPELVWFPDPLGAVDCARGDLSEAVLLRRLLPEVPQIAVKMGRPTAHPIPQRVRRLGRRPAPQALSLIHI